MTQPQNAVTQYLNQRIATCGRTPTEIADACGIKVRYIELFRNGAYKVPIDVAGPLAVAIGGSPRELFPLVMSQNLPGVWEAILET